MINTTNVKPKADGWKVAETRTAGNTAVASKEAVQSSKSNATYPKTSVKAAPAVAHRSVGEKLAANARSAASLAEPKQGFAAKVASFTQAARIVTDAAQERAKNSSSEGGWLNGAKNFAADVSGYYKDLSATASAKATNKTSAKEEDIGGKVWDLITKSKSIEDAIDKVGGFGRDKILNRFKTDLESEIKGLLGLGEKAAATAGKVAAGAAAAEESLGSVVSSTANKILGAAGAAYSVYSIVKDFGHLSLSSGVTNGLAAGAYAGSFFGPVGTVIGGGIGAVAGGIASLFHNSGKSAEQKERDQMRKSLQNLGLIDAKFTLALADGTRYDIGKDGGFKLKNVDGTDRPAYGVDLSDPRVGTVIGWVNPLATLIAGDNDRLKTSLAGYLTNAAMSNAQSVEQAKENARGFYSALNIGPADIAQALDQARQAKKISADLERAYVGGLVDLYTDSSSAADTVGSPAETSSDDGENAEPEELQLS